VTAAEICCGRAEAHSLILFLHNRSQDRRARPENAMDESAQTIQIPLTPEQQEMIRRLSGQFAQMLELVPETGDGASGQGRGLQFRWRLSVATGIPRQKWGPGGEDPAPAEGDPPA